MWSFVFSVLMSFSTWSFSAFCTNLSTELGPHTEKKSISTHLSIKSDILPMIHNHWKDFKSLDQNYVQIVKFKKN